MIELVASALNLLAATLLTVSLYLSFRFVESVLHAHTDTLSRLLSLMERRTTHD